MSAALDRAGAEWESHWRRSTAKGPHTLRRESDWIANPIDAFVLSRLDKEGFITRRRPILRRCFVVSASISPGFHRDRGNRHVSLQDLNAAYPAAVDRLLASPHYGERWASLARFRAIRRFGRL